MIQSQECLKQNYFKFSSIASTMPLPMHEIQSLTSSVSFQEDFLTTFAYVKNLAPSIHLLGKGASRIDKDN